MGRPTRPTVQCLFCLLGLTKPSPSRLPTTRAFSTGIPLQRLLGIQRKRRRDQRDEPSSRKSPEITDSRPRGPGKRSLDLKDPEIGTHTPERLLQRLQHALVTVYKWLGKSKDNQKSQLQSLDADGEQWKQFKTSTLGLLERPTASLDRQEREHHSELSRTLSSSSWLDKTTGYLYFIFLDQALAANGLGVSHVMNKTMDLRYPTEWYPEARVTQRDIHLHIGPTNSGKTYNALKRLESAKSGFYAGPLRLLAHEVYSRFNSQGVKCDLITGDDVRVQQGEDENPRYSSTVEMVDVTKEVEVAVIDEIQMIADAKRGWAWTRALVGCKAKEVHLCGEPRVLSLVKELAASMGDNLHVHRYERLNPLRLQSRSLRGDFKKLRKGDCVVTFSIMNIHALRKQIEVDSGRRVAIVYGSLPPETRAEQAALFNDSDNDYDFLVASDAIGMGLNLSIKRIIFDSVEKFDGITRRQLSIPQIKQIAGRAGRYRTARDDNNKRVDAKDSKAGDSTSVGLVTCVDEKDLPVIQDALTREAPPIRQAGLIPLGDFIVAWAERVPLGVSHEYMMQRICDAASLHPRFSLCEIKEQLGVARTIESVPGLTTVERCVFTASPAKYRTLEEQCIIQAFARAVGSRKPITVADVKEIPLEVLEIEMSPDKTYLKHLEELHKSLILFLWLSYRFPAVFVEQDMAFHAKGLAEEKIDTYLKSFSANKQLQRRLWKLQSNSASNTMKYKPGAVDDHSEHAHEDLFEEDAANVEQAELVMEGAQEEVKIIDDSHTSALPVDWTRRADGSNAELSNEDHQQPREQAAGNR
jgi:ATP-dependent RNA helicase SUPV3L1/SUV3